MAHELVARCQGYLDNYEYLIFIHLYQDSILQQIPYSCCVVQDVDLPLSPANDAPMAAEIAEPHDNDKPIDCDTL